MVTHVDVDDDGLAFALDAWRTIAETMPRTMKET
jgi:hypothetical protein